MPGRQNKGILSAPVSLNDDDIRAIKKTLINLTAFRLNQRFLKPRFRRHAGLPVENRLYDPDVIIITITEEIRNGFVRQPGRYRRKHRSGALKVRNPSDFF